MRLLCQKIVSLLIKKKLTISVAESCTGGLLSSAITSVSGSSKVFNLGLVAYSNQNPFLNGRRLLYLSLVLRQSN